MDRSLKVRGSDWVVDLQGVDGDTIENLIIHRLGNQNFHGTMAEDSVMINGEEKRFRCFMLFEHDQGKDKVGDVVIQLRRDPVTGRYKVQVEKENALVDETTTNKIWRAMRSSVDNIVQAVKKTVIHTGWIYTNARRQGGKMVKTHYVDANWAPQLADQMMDVFDYVQTHDSPGHSAFLKALQVMPDRLAKIIFNQMRTPPKD